jgi:arylsulfatase A
MQCDDLGWGDPGVYGHPMIRTPNLDRLATEGLRLTACYAAAPVCSPSRAALQTGRIPQREGITDWIRPGSEIHLRREAVTIARVLRTAGYATCFAGKWHLSGTFEATQPTPGDHGYDHWLASLINSRPNHLNPDNFVRNGVPLGPQRGPAAALVADEAARWLAHQPFSRPVFMCVTFHEPHEPVGTADEFLRLYPDVAPPERAAYYGNVSQMDAAVGRLMRALEETGRASRTLVVFTSDNGPETLNRYRGAEHSYGSPGPFRGMKLHLTEGGIRVPGIVRWPGVVRPKTESGEPVSGVDWLPTLCAAAGVEPPSDRALDGVNLLPFLKGGGLERRTPLYWQYDVALGAARAAVRDGDWKLLAHEGLERVELYNVKDDPGESRDLAAQEPARAAALLDRLKAIHREVNGN